MKNREMNNRIIFRGKTFLDGIRVETPSLFNKDRWIGKGGRCSH